MIDFNELFKRNDVGSIIGELKQRVLDIPLWSTLLSEYEPMLHEIVEDHVEIGRAHV